MRCVRRDCRSKVDPDHEAQVEAFKIEHGVKPSDRFITVSFLSADDPEPIV